MRKLLLEVVAIRLAAPVPGLTAPDCSRGRSDAKKMPGSNSRFALAEGRTAYAFYETIHHGADPFALMKSQGR